MENGYKEEIEKLLKKTDDINFEIRGLRRDNTDLTTVNNDKIEILQEEMGQVEFKMKDAFTKTGDDKVQTKMGFTTWKEVKDKRVFSDKTIGEIQTKYPGEAEDYIKTSYSLKLDPLKKAIEGGAIVLKEMKIELGIPKFVYKYTGGNK